MKKLILISILFLFGFSAFSQVEINKPFKLKIDTTIIKDKIIVDFETYEINVYEKICIARLKYYIGNSEIKPEKDLKTDRTFPAMVSFTYNSSNIISQIKAKIKEDLLYYNKEFWESSDIIIK